MVTLPNRGIWLDSEGSVVAAFCRACMCIISLAVVSQKEQFQIRILPLVHRSRETRLYQSLDLNRNTL
jgi:hypothetical protein